MQLPTIVKTGLRQKNITAKKPFLTSNKIKVKPRGRGKSHIFFKMSTVDPNFLKQLPFTKQVQI